MSQISHSHFKTLLFFNLLSLGAFLFFLYAVLSQSAFMAVDQQVSEAMSTIQTEARTTVVLFITNIGGVIGASVLTVLFSLYLIIKKAYRDLQLYLGAFIAAAALFTVIKHLVERTRPLLKIIDEQGYAFPSGHSTMSMTMALSFYFIFSDKMQSLKQRGLLLGVMMLWPVSIVFTRLYLNVHWLSDTLAGVSLGIFVTTFIVIVLGKRP